MSAWHNEAGISFPVKLIHRDFLSGGNYFSKKSGYFILPAKKTDKI